MSAKNNDEAEAGAAVYKMIVPSEDVGCVTEMVRKMVASKRACCEVHALAALSSVVYSIVAPDPTDPVLMESFEELGASLRQAFAKGVTDYVEQAEGDPQGKLVH